MQDSDVANINGRSFWVVAGVGGHRAQAERFCVLAEDMQVRVVRLYERKTILIPNISQASKASPFWSNVVSLISLLWVPIWVLIILVFFREKKAFVVFGPACCIPVLVAAKITKTPAVFLESWSRFNTISRTASFAKRLGVRVVKQNIETDSGCIEEYYGRLG